MSIVNSNWFIFRTDEYYYPQAFWKECNYIIKERKIHNYIGDDLEISPDSDEDILDKIQIKKNSDEKDSKEEEDSNEKKKNITKNCLTIEEIVI